MNYFLWLQAIFTPSFFNKDEGTSPIFDTPSFFNKDEGTSPIFDAINNKGIF